MRIWRLLAATALTAVIAGPAIAQTAGTTSAQNTAPSNGPGQDVATSGETDTGIGDIVVTAQRQSQRLQDVPIAVSAFTADNLEKQQIVNPTSLQQTLPNITFTKTNFTSSSFTIRGIGDLCVGASCDSATAIHVNDMPLLGTRLFESEFFDLERVEVLRGPQGTLFGRNATSGVVNFITAKPDLLRIRAAGEFEYGNYDSKRVRAMFNLPLTDTLGIRLAGTYLNRNGYTTNLFNGDRIDDRDLYSIRGTLSYEPSSDTRIDLIGYYFHEKDNRSRIQKQLCHRDPTGVLGCLPDRLANETLNGNSTLASILTSQEFFRAAGIGALAPVALGSIYGTDQFNGVVNPLDPRTVRVDTRPTYFADEEQYTAKVFHDFGDVSLNFTGGYMRNKVDSISDYNLAVENTFANNIGLNTLNAAARPGGPLAILNNVRQYLIPNGPSQLCQSPATPNNSGVYGGNSICAPTSLDFDRSVSDTRQYSMEAHIDSSFEGAFNFLIGGIYFDSKTKNNDYYVNSFGLDYISGVLGSALSGGTSFSATPFYRNNFASFRLKSYGVFGETYFTFTDKLKLTIGLRYNHDDKTTSARTSFLTDNAVPGRNPLVPFGTADANTVLNNGTYDFDATLAGNQPFADASVSFGRLTGRAVFDYKVTASNLLYASYSRGYKSGGINPPLSSAFQVPTTFDPEGVDAFEIGSKNTFLDGSLRLNLTGFYYKYKRLQLSRIVARTSVNDNVDANIYGVEAEAIVSPVPALVINMNFSYLHSKVSSDKFLANPRDPSGGRSDAVIIKDITNTANCAVQSTSGSAAGANAYVNAINGGINASTGAGLRGTTAIPGTNTTGAFGICSALADSAATVGPAFGGIQVLGSGVAVNVRGNQLPNAPTYKVSAGIQYTIDFGSSGFTLVPRAEINYTGDSWGTIFNKNPIDRIRGYEVVNAQLQLNAPDDRFFVRGFVQNLTKNNAITGLYVTDQSSGLFTNIFTIEPRRYGVAAGLKF
jgi:iron complex outermembrane receptor protein